MLVVRRVGRARAVAPHARRLSSWWWDEDPKGKKEGGEGRRRRKPATQRNPDAIPPEGKKGAAEGRDGAGEAASQSEHKASAAGQSEPKASAASIAPVLALQGAPRQPNVLALPLDRRPLFPGLLHPLQITDIKVYQALVRARTSGSPYIGLFLRKYDVASRDMVEHLPSEHIASLSEVHQVGTFAQIIQMEPLQPALASGNAQWSPSGGDGQDAAAGMKGVGQSIGDESDSWRGSSSQLHITEQAVKDASEESWTIVVKAHRRIKIEEWLEAGPPPLLRVQHLNDFPVSAFDSDTIRAYTNEVVATLRDVIRHNPLLREHMNFFSSRFDMSDPHHVCNLAASLTSAEGHELQEIMDSMNLEVRLQKVLTILKKEVQLNRLQEQISKQVEETISTNQRKYFLNEQLKQIKKELGLEHDDKDALLAKFQQKFDALNADSSSTEPVFEEEAPRENPESGSEGQRRRRIIRGGLPKEAKKVIEDEMKKLSTLEKSSPEFNVTRAYLDWLLALPWGRCTEENLDIGHASKVLEADHFGLSDIKERILEFIAVGNLRGTVEGKIILLVGPPGVGKTSIGKSIARALEREFFRFSVGGLSDVSEIKGHRRTYIGAMPGKLIQCLKSTGVSNPVVLIDEIDKLGSGYRGDPASALLELLDPAQNSSFVDHYIDTPVDLSKVLFVCTANSLDTIPGPLLDRMEVLRLSGYDLPEKVAIAKQYLEPRAKQSSGLAIPEGASEDERERKQARIPEVVGIDEAAMKALAKSYCREAGVRKLQQHIERIYRKLALEILKADEPVDFEKDWIVTEDKLEKYVGKQRYQSDKLYDDIPPPGVVMGLAWSTTGGSALYIETTCIRRAPLRRLERAVGDVSNAKAERPASSGAAPSGRPPAPFSVHVTGQLGDVMKESSSLALTYSRHKLQEVDSENDFFEENQIHLHVPEGATPKDGPSAGVTMVTALLSLALNRSVIANLAMTGEIGLTGMVLPVGGIKEKVIAARRSGVDTIVLPHGNSKDVDELPVYLKEGLTIHFAKTYDDVYRVAFGMQDQS